MNDAGDISTGGRGGFGGGFTFTELVVVVVILSLFVAMAQLNLFGLLDRNRLKMEAGGLAAAIEMAGRAAAENDKRYEVIIDLAEQAYTLRQITTPDLSQVLEEEIIEHKYLPVSCQVAYVEFDDGDFTNEGRAKFRAGRSGWQYGGKIVLVSSDRTYSVVVNRINRIVELSEGDVQVTPPRLPEQMLF
jgi:Tfp pilus assembly protein FimT